MSRTRRPRSRAAALAWRPCLARRPPRPRGRGATGSKARGGAPRGRGASRRGAEHGRSGGSAARGLPPLARRGAGAGVEPRASPVHALVVDGAPVVRGACSARFLVLELRPVGEASTTGRRGTRPRAAPPSPPGPTVLFLPNAPASLAGRGAGLEAVPRSTPTSTTRPRRHREQGARRRTTRPRRLQARSRAR